MSSARRFATLADRIAFEETGGSGELIGAIEADVDALFGRT